MLRKIWLMICLFSIIPLQSSGQWLLKTVYLPDSLCGGHGPGRLVYNPQNNKIYVGNVRGNVVNVIDGAINQKIARVPIGGSCSDFCYNSVNNKIYSAHSDSDKVTVIDGASNNVIATIPVGDYPGALCYNPTNNKVYCANFLSATITVIDGATDNIITTIALPSSGLSENMVYNPVNNCIYCGNGHYITVIDGQSNGIIKNVFLGTATTFALVYSTGNNKIYASSHLTDEVAVIDCATNNVIKFIAVGDYPRWLCYNSNYNKVYCANYNGNSITVINSNTDEVIATISNIYSPGYLCCNPVDNKIYCSRYSYVTIINCATDTKIKDVYYAYSSAFKGLAYNSLNNQLYGADYGNDYVIAIDGAMDTISALIPTGGYPLAVTYNSTNNKVYTANSANNSISVIDGATSNIITNISVGTWPTAYWPFALVYNYLNNKIYCSNGKAMRISVIDGSSDTIIKTISLNTGTTNYPYALEFNPTNNKVYCAQTEASRVTVINCATDDTIKSIYTSGGPGVFCYNSTNNKIYCGTASDIAVIDGANDNIITTLPWTWVRDMCYNNVNNKVYILRDKADSAVIVLNGATDAIDTVIPLPSPLPSGICYNPKNNKFYCGFYDSVAIFNALTNNLITKVKVGAGFHNLLYNFAGNKVYCANDDANTVTVIDGSTNSVITTIPVGVSPLPMTINPLQNRIYVVNRYSSSISVIQDPDIGIEETARSYGIAKRENQEVEVYPNPVRNLMKFKLPAMEIESKEDNRLSIEIYDACGRLVKKSLIAAGEQLALSKEMNPGIKFLKIKIESKEYWKKIVVLGDK